MVRFDLRIHSYDEYDKLSNIELKRLVISDIAFYASAKAALALTMADLIVAAIFMWLVAGISLVTIVVTIVRFNLIPSKLTEKKIVLDWDPDCWDQLDD